MSITLILSVLQVGMQRLLVDVDVRTIGEDVWPGWDRWMAGTDYHSTWSRNWLLAAREGLLAVRREAQSCATATKNSDCGEIATRREWASTFGDGDHPPS